MESLFLARAETILLKSAITPTIKSLPDTSTKVSKSTIKNSIKEWSQVTSDQDILNAVTMPIQNTTPPELSFCSAEVKVISNKIRNPLDKKDIDQAGHFDGTCISNMFMRDKKNGKFRTILNLKELNKHFSYFKMRTFGSIPDLVNKDCFIPSLDLKDAYHIVPISKEHRKYLRFYWEGRRCQFCFLPFGLSSTPGIFIKILVTPLWIL